MYLRHFQLEQFPFSRAYDQRFFCTTSENSELISNATSTLAMPAATVVICGPEGIGKTCLFNEIIEKVGESSTIIKVENKLSTSEELLLEIASQLKIPTLNNDQNWLASTIKSCLEKLAERGKQVVLTADDCENLNPAVLDAMLQLSQVKTGENALVKILLTCDESYKKPTLLESNITFTAKLSPLSAGQVASYIDHRIEVASEGKLVLQFTLEAKDLIARSTDGIPTKVNQLCDNLLTNAFNQGIYTVDLPLVNQTLEQLGKTPPATKSVKLRQPQTSDKPTTVTFGNYHEKLIAFHHPQSPQSRQFRQLRDNLLTHAQANSCWMITSNTKSEGKTTTTANLGLVFAELSDKKTLLIEATPASKLCLAAMFNYPPTTGLTEICTGRNTLEKAVKPTASSNLFVLPAGLELDATPNIAQLELICQQAKTIYDYIIVDLPSLQELTPAQLAQSTAQVMLVTKLHYTKAADLQLSSELLKSAGVNVAGIVVTQ